MDTLQQDNGKSTSSSTLRDQKDSNNDDFRLAPTANDRIQLRPRQAYEAYSSSYSVDGSQSDVRDDSDSNYEAESRNQSTSPGILSPAALRDPAEEGNNRARLSYCLRTRDKRLREDNDNNTQYHISSLRSSATVSAIISSSEDDDDDDRYHYNTPLRKKPKLKQQQPDVVNSPRLSSNSTINFDQSTHHNPVCYSLMDPNEAIQYLTKVKCALNPEEYNQFLDIMRAAKSDR